MAQPSAHADRYLADFALFELKAAPGEAPWLRDLRREAMQRFAEAGFPTARRGNEAWKYTDVGPIARTPFRYVSPMVSTPVPGPSLRALMLAPQWPRLVFVDGRYRADLSFTGGLPAGVQVANLAEAEPEALAPHLAQRARLNGDAFIALNTAFLRDGAFVQVPRGATADRPIHLLFVATGEPDSVFYPRALLLLGPGSSAAVIESHAGLSRGRYFSDAVTEIVMEEGATLRRYKLLQEGEGAYHVAATHVRQSRGSAFHDISIAAGGALARNGLNVLLDGEGAACHLNGLYLTAGERHVDNTTFIDHARPRTVSGQLYKGILDGKSRAVFSGRVLVRRDAQKADARQTNKNLILSDGAEVDTKPHLEIFADDVKCSHGATAGRLDEGSVFYLRSRGLDEQRARALLAHAFASEVLDVIPAKQVRARVEKLLLANLPRLEPRG